MVHVKFFEGVCLVLLCVLDVDMFVHFDSSPAGIMAPKPARAKGRRTAAVKQGRGCSIRSTASPFLSSHCHRSGIETPPMTLFAREQGYQVMDGTCHTIHTPFTLKLPPRQVLPGLVWMAGMACDRGACEGF